MERRKMEGWRRKKLGAQVPLQYFAASAIA
jgi:hypothetical protein